MKRQWTALVLVIALGLSLCSCTDQPGEIPVDLPILDNPEARGAVAPQTTPDPQPVEDKTAVFGGVSYTLLEVNPDYISAGKYATPKAGYHFVTVKLQYQNQNETAVEVSSLLMLSVLDELGNEYPITITVSDLPQTLDGSIASGGSLEGYAAFEVPLTAEHLTLVIKPNLFTEDQVQFVLF